MNFNLHVTFDLISDDRAKAFVNDVFVGYVRRLKPVTTKQRRYLGFMDDDVNDDKLYKEEDVTECKFIFRNSRESGSRLIADHMPPTSTISEILTHRRGKAIEQAVGAYFRACSGMFRAQESAAVDARVTAAELAEEAKLNADPEPYDAEWEEHVHEMTH